MKHVYLYQEINETFYFLLSGSTPAKKEAHQKMVGLSLHFTCLLSVRAQRVVLFSDVLRHPNHASDNIQAS